MKNVQWNKALIEQFLEKEMGTGELPKQAAQTGRRNERHK